MKNFRKSYLENKEKFFSRIQSLFFVIDIQRKEKFDEAIQYLKEIVNIVLELNPNYSQFFIFFHKYDPDIKSNNEILESIKYLKDEIKSIESTFFFYRTSIYDESTLLKAFSDGVISVSHKSQLIQTLLKEYMKKAFSSAAILLDQQFFIISSRATSENYEIVCQEVAPRLAQALEKLEEWGINTIDIVANIEFPQMSESKEGIIFLKKLDIKNVRLYLVSLCLNKNIKTRSYEFLPKLANNLKSLLESFE